MDVRKFFRACAACLLGAAASAHALPPAWVAVDAAALDSLRGGFTTARGLDVSLGIERLVTVNGELVWRTSVGLANLGALDAEQARQTGAALSEVKLVRNGHDNMMVAGLSDATPGGTLIQNSLDGQHIASRTVINASVNSLDLLKTINFQGNLSDAIARAAVAR